jgi:hypothetical protein
MAKPKFTEFKVSLNLPYIGGIEGTWEPDKSERDAAWEMYVEIITRISVAELQPDEGMLREALASLYTLFESTRKILREYGPTVAQPKGSGTLSFGYLAVAILNTVLRPLLSHWHPLLKDYEDHRPTDVASVEYERTWHQYADLRAEINKLRVPLTEYANLLAQVAGVPSLIIERDKPAV